MNYIIIMHAAWNEEYTLQKGKARLSPFLQKSDGMSFRNSTSNTRSGISFIIIFMEHPKHGGSYPHIFSFLG